METLLREGIIRFEGKTPQQIRHQLSSTVVDRLPETLITQLAKTGASDSAIASLDRLVQFPIPPESESAEDHARSYAEQFLWESLECMSQTTGLFHLNQSLDFRHGRKLAEADLICSKLKLVIELDGRYFHLSNPASYRRDRRKDWEYQKHGYTVLRFLSEDVISHHEEILRTVQEAVVLKLHELLRSQEGTT